jgi:trimeric autotransporter adhesin
VKHVKFHLNRFLRRVRIHGGEFDTSARAMYRNEVVYPLQADLRIVRRSTNERKQMSTKTTFKRIALVTVAALGFGVMSVAPSSAADNVILKYATGDGAAAAPFNTGAGVAGPANTVTLTYDQSSTLRAVVVIDGGASSTIQAAETLTANGLQSQLSKGNGDKAIVINTPAVGTIVASVYLETADGSGLFSSTAKETVTISVAATASSGAYNAANSTFWITSGETHVAPTVDASITAIATAQNDTAVATIIVSMKDALKGAYGDTVTATIVSGPGTITGTMDTNTVIGKKAGYLTGSNSESITGVAGQITKALVVPDAFRAGTVAQKTTTGEINNGDATDTATAAGTGYFFVFPNGQSGVSTIRLTLSDGTVIGTKTVTFSSTTVASIAATTLKVNVSADAAGRATDDAAATDANAKAISFVLKDEAGFPVAGNTATTFTSSNTAIIADGSCATATDSTGTGYCTITPVAAKYGKVTLTLKNNLKTSAVEITAAANKAATVTIVPSADTAEAGSKITYTATFKDASGNAIADGTYAPGAFFASEVTSSGTNAAWGTDTVTVKAGAATKEIYLPFVSGTFTITWNLKGTAATATAVAVGTDNIAAAIADTDVVANVQVVNAGIDAAAAAAEEATAAANDATDAALSAAEAAEAATAMAQEAVDAVAELSAQVTTLISALRKQITTLTNLVVKIQKKVKA